MSKETSTFALSRALPRIGVIICQCGTELSSALDLSKVEEHARALSGVVYAKTEAYPCSRPGIAALKNLLKEKGLERVVIAGCTPRLHGRFVAKALEETALNRWYIEVANIREHCSRVHRNKAEATEKAKELVAASVKKVALAEACEPIKSKPRNAVLVVGGGASGLAASGTLADLGNDVTLVEKEDVLGGMLLKLDKPYPFGKSAKEIAKERISRIDGRVRIFTRTEVYSLKGAPGQYLVQLSTDGKLKEQEFGAIVVAVGAECISVEELLRTPLLKGISEFAGRVITQLELEAETAGKPARGVLGNMRSVLFVGASVPELSHSGARLFSLVALKNAAILKEGNPDLQAWFLFDDLPSDLEREFRRARNAGVQFVRPDDPSVLRFVREGLRGCGDLEINVDLVVLPSFLRMPSSARKLAEVLRIPVDARGFFIQPHIKLWRNDFAERGIFVIGSCHSPATLLEASEHATAAASLTTRFVTSEIVRAPLLSNIDRKVCRGCRRCFEACQWDAIEMIKRESDIELAVVDEVLCTGCGVCSTVCINGAPSLAPVSQKQIRAMLEVVGA